MTEPEDVAAAILARHNIVDDEKPEPSPTGRPWPAIDETAFAGLPGRIVNTIGPHTEADPAAMLATLYAAAGAMIGDRPHVLTGGVEHGARVWPLIIGRTAGGVKGTSWAEVRRVLKAADAEFCHDRVMGGLSSAEGLIFQVRDPTGDPESDTFDEGASDKRLLIVESEFASVLAQGKREGNTLLPVLRQSWDGGTLRTMTVKPRVATDPHIVIVGHITPTELRAKLSDSERAGGTMNRFLPVLSKRSKLLPDGGDLSDATVKGLGAELADQILQARTVARMSRTPEAARYWRDLYKRLAADHAGDGPVAQVVARAAPQVLRLSVLATLLDGRDRIDVSHLQAAEAFWDYVEDSAWYTFGSGTGNPDLDRLKSFVDNAGDDGVGRTGIANDCFGKHRTKAQLDALVSELTALGDYEEWSKPTGGRPVQLYRRIKQK
ncbi:DUF3987 domain-containing protein [Embleya sp. NPDC059259]|uniref:DUF3987 domain-containing protein n=1 Tax=unclassified Embleya TaxID=2699296 RepID=UPI003699B736